MRGYWGDTQRTAQSLVPTVHNPTQLAYRTGDIVRLTPEGDFEFQGRRDHQIKSRGYRIELGDIETTLHTAPAIAECAVLAVPDGEITNRLAAFVVPSGQHDPATLCGHCASRLPHYMIPDFEYTDRLPRTSTGKVDRQALARTLAQGPGKEHVDA